MSIKWDTIIFPVDMLNISSVVEFNTQPKQWFLWKNRGERVAML